jgi:hypothetical protein
MIFVILAVGLVWVVYKWISGGSNAPTNETWSQTMGRVMASFENSNPAYNNPMAVQGTGDTGTTAPNGLGIYSSVDAGMSAGIALLESYAARFPTLTVRQAISRWATNKINPDDIQDDNLRASVDNETQLVADALYIDPDVTTLGDLAGTAGDP